MQTWDDRPVAATAANAATALYERGRELLALAAAIEGAQAGSGSLVIIEGPPGIGKTRLLSETVAMAADRSLLVLAGSGFELERANPYGVARQLLERPLLTAAPQRRELLLEGAARHAGQALGIGSATGADAFAVLHGLYWLVANLADDAPLLLAVDDLQWADPASVRFMSYLARRLAELRAALIVGVRPREVNSDEGAPELLTQADAVVLCPAALTERATTALLTDRLSACPAVELTAACHHATGGNPFLLHELSVAMRDEGLAGRSAGVERLADLRPQPLVRSVERRLASMPAAARMLAEAVAVTGRDATLRDAAAVAQIDVREAQTAVTALVRAELLAAELPLAFVHPLVRAAVYGDLEPVHRAALHAAAARRLTEAQAPPERIATHLLHVEPAGTSQVAATLWQAAGAALARGAPDAAVALLARALAEPPAGELRANILGALGLAEFLTRPAGPDARAHLRAAIAATADEADRARLWLLLARATLIGCSGPSSVAVLQGALAALPGSPEEPVERLRTALIGEAAGHPLTAALADQLTDHLDEPPGLTPAERLRLCSCALAEGRRAGSAARTIALSRRALGGNALIEHETGDFTSIAQLIHHLVFADALADADTLAAAALDDARARGSTYGVLAMTAARAWVCFRAGDLPSAEVDARQVFTHPMLMELGRPFTAGVLASTLVDRGGLDDAASVLADLDYDGDTARGSHGALVLVARGRLRRAQGDRAGAITDFLEYGRRMVALGWDNPAIAWRAEAAEDLAALGEHRRAERLASAQLGRGRRWGAPSAIGAGLRAAGLATGGEDGIEQLREAVRVLAASPARLEHARTMLVLGGALRRCGLRIEARVVLRDAIERSRRCGATALSCAGQAELIAAGARPRRKRFSGVEALTASERRVGTLAAEGLTNREIAQILFVTARTVENHLGHVYVKLGISSRRGLAGALDGARDEPFEIPFSGRG